MPTIVHFDISADNPDRAKKFYEDVFGWKVGLIAGFEGYYEVETTDLNGAMGVGGGITKRENPRQNGILHFIGVSSIDGVILKINDLGGKIIQSKQEIPGYGYIAVCSDTEDNIFGLFEEDMKTGKMAFAYKGGETHLL